MKRRRTESRCSFHQSEVVIASGFAADNPHEYLNDLEFGGLVVRIKQIGYVSAFDQGITDPLLPAWRRVEF